MTHNFFSFFFILFLPFLFLWLSRRQSIQFALWMTNWLCAAMPKLNVINNECVSLSLSVCEAWNGKKKKNDLNDCFHLTRVEPLNRFHSRIHKFRRSESMWRNIAVGAYSAHSKTYSQFIFLFVFGGEITKHTLNALWKDKMPIVMYCISKTSFLLLILSFYLDKVIE